MFSFLKPLLKPKTQQKQGHLRDILSVIRFKEVARRAAVGAAVGALIEEEDEPNGRQGPQGPKRPEIPFHWEHHVSRLTEQEFQLRYRVSKAAFSELLHLLWEDLRQRNLAQAKRSKCEPTSSDKLKAMP